jgi:CPA1 family monovalent cation:H+ antiporter
MPGLPAITLNPDLVLLLFLPPLVYSSAWFTSWREFRTSLRPILLLAVGKCHSRYGEPFRIMHE